MRVKGLLLFKGRLAVDADGVKCLCTLIASVLSRHKRSPLFLFFLFSYQDTLPTYPAKSAAGHANSDPVTLF